MAEGNERDRRGWVRVVWGLGSLLALLGLLLLAGAVRSVSVPLLVAFIAAYFLTPVVKALTKRGMPTNLAIALILLVAFLLVASFFAALGPQLAEEFAGLPEKLRLMGDRVIAWAEARFEVDLSEARAAVADLFVEKLKSIPTEGLGAVGAVREPARNVLAAIYGGAAGTLAALVGLVMSLVFTFFMLRDFDKVVAGIRDLVPPRYRDFVVARAREIDQAMSSFLRGQISVALILAVLYAVGFLIVGLPLAVAVGIIAGLGNVVPYLGTAIGITLATGLVLLEDPGWGALLATWGVFLVVQTLEGWVITPKIVGESLDLSPFLVIVAVMVFGELFGFVGVLVAVPLTAVLKILGRSLLSGYRDSAWFTEAEP